MGWEKRARGGRYYTRSRREAGRVVREYMGNGEVAVLTARMDALARAERERRRAGAQEEQQQYREAMALLDALCQRADTLAHAALVLAGYRQHKRGEWRRRRGERTGRTEA